MEYKTELFENGSAWLKAYFNLYTKADQIGGNQFLNGLEEQKINIGVITNHNQFFIDEFKELREKALNRNIFLLPGIQLNVKGGKNGIHTLIVFNYKKWIDYEKNDNHIEEFIRAIFGTKTIKPGETTNENLIRTIERLNGFHADYFIILAHVDRDNGFFKETKRANRETDFYGNPLFENSVIGFHKLEIEESKKEIIEIYGEEKLPAILDGAGPTSVSKPGPGQAVCTYIKIGAFNFEALKYALLNPSARINHEIPKTENCFIKNISFSGGILGGQTIHLNSNMNNFIGIRGSGKSIILESIRYALNIPFGKQSKDRDYKEKLVYHMLGSGGKIIVNIVGKHGTNYRIEKIYNEKPEVFRGDKRITDLEINKGIINALYFGQKDLSEIGVEGFSEDLIEKFFGERIKNVRKNIINTEQEIIKTIGELKILKGKLKNRSDYQDEKGNIEEKLRIFLKHNVDEKLKRQVGFNRDISKLKDIIEFEQSIIDSFDNIITENKGDFDSYLEYENAEENKLRFEKVMGNLQAFRQKFNSITRLVKEGENDIEGIIKIKEEIEELASRLKDEFAKIKQKINIDSLNPDDYIAYTNRLNIVNASLSQLVRLAAKEKELEEKLVNLLSQLKENWNDEYDSLKGEIDRLNRRNLSIKIDIVFKGNQAAFEQFLQDSLRGTNISKGKIKKISESYRDPIEIYRDLDNEGAGIKEILSGNLLLKFRKHIENIKDRFLIYRVPDKLTLNYNGVELEKHSLGQRASAFIIFILTKKDNDIIIIDQPEDDLDNQSIYEDIIKELAQLKQQTQFIFATHNPNIPVLGECEQVIRCSYLEGTIDMRVGSIDCKSIQREIIEVMEGGEEAFNKRKRIYKLWKN